MTTMATTAGENGSGRNWTFLTNHGHVLLAIARNPTARLRDVADEVGVTERAAQAIVADLEAGGYLRRTRVGRRNEYTINPSGHFGTRRRPTSRSAPCSPSSPPSRPPVPTPDARARHPAVGAATVISARA